jgi:hypothetical protein
LRLTVARRGAILASLVIFLALMLGPQQPIAQQYTPTPTPSEAYMVHDIYIVGARSLERIRFSVCDGCRFTIIFYVYDANGRPSCIIFRALDPEGREIYPRGKVGWLQWSFTAKRSGIYVLEFDNTYIILTDKYIDLALDVRPPTRTTTIEYRTSTATVTEYRTSIEYRTTVTETQTISPSILSLEGMLILTLVAAVAFIAGILLTLLARRS